MSVRTRIAPSPTGFMHIGTLRTALYNYMLARQKGGEFLIRIEDTDRERLVEGAVENLLRTFQAIGIEHDEGPVFDDNGILMDKGEKGPYVQSERLAIYKQFVHQLVEEGKAYPCFCTKERLEAMREEQRLTKQTPKYDRTCALLDSSVAKERLLAGETHVIRMRIPEGSTTFTDEIRGDITFSHSEIDDQVILKSDGFPTYHLAVVVDDHLMEITHVIRGEEWISSTPKHIILYEMFGWQAPKFAHVPLLLNPDKTKLSKRQGDVAVEDYLKRGYVPKALINFIATLGFNPKSDQELYELEELTALFELSKVNSSGAVLNMEKLDWMNNHYIRQMTEEELVNVTQPFVQANLDAPLLRRAMMIERARISRLEEFQAVLLPYMEEPHYDPSVLIWKKSDANGAMKELNGVKAIIESMEKSQFETIESLESTIKAYITENALQNGDVLWPLRVALSGKEKSASPFELLYVLQKEASLARIEHALKLLV